METQHYLAWRLKATAINSGNANLRISMEQNGIQQLTCTHKDTWFLTEVVTQFSGENRDYCITTPRTMG